MSNLGYSLEHEVERELLRVSKQTIDLPLLSRTYRVPSSGAMRGEKGDIQTRFPWPYKQWMIECKSRKYKTKCGSSIRIKYEWLHKCFSEAQSCDRIPVLIFSFKGKRKNRIWVIFWKSHLPEKFIMPTDFGVKSIKTNKSSFLFTESDFIGINNGFMVSSKNTEYIVVSFVWLLKWLETILI